MRVLALCKTETGFQVLGQVLLLLNSRNDSLVNLLLVSRLGFWERLFWFGLALLEELRLCRRSTLHHSLGEVCVVDLGVNLPRRSNQRVDTLYLLANWQDTHLEAFQVDLR